MVEPFPYITVDNGGDVVFNCTADGGPNNMFAWVRSKDIANIDICNNTATNGCGDVTRRNGYLELYG